MLEGSLSPGDGAVQLRAVAEAGSPYSKPLTVIAYAISSAASAVFFGGGKREVVLAAALGLVTGLLALVAERVQTLEKVFATAAAILVAGLATVTFPRARPAPRARSSPSWASDSG